MTYFKNSNISDYQVLFHQPSSKRQKIYLWTMAVHEKFDFVVFLQFSRELQRKGTIHSIMRGESFSNLITVELNKYTSFNIIFMWFWPRKRKEIGSRVRSDEPLIVPIVTITYINKFVFWLKSEFLSGCSTVSCVLDVKLNRSRFEVDETNFRFCENKNWTDLLFFSISFY